MTASNNTLLSLNNYHYRRGGADAVFLDHDALFKTIGWNTAQFSMQHPKNLPSVFAPYFVDEIELGREYSLARKISLASKIVYSFEARDKLARLVADISPDIAHVHSVYHHISPSVLSLLRDRGIPVVLTAHDLKLLCPAYTMLSNGNVCEKCKPHKIWNVALNRCVKGSAALSTLVGLEAAVHRLLGSYRKNCNRIVVPSRFYERKFVEWGWPENRLRYIPNYVDAANITPAEDVGNYFVYFGRIAREKGVETLVRAAAMASVSVVVAGTGDESENLQRLTEELGADVSFVGFQSGDALWSIIRHAKAVILPSEWYENAPISVLEAYAFGKPVIGAAIGGIPELISEDECGWLFKSGDVAELAAVLERVAGFENARIRAAGLAGRQVVEQRYSREHYLQAMLDLYRELGVGQHTG